MNLAMLDVAIGLVLLYLLLSLVCSALLEGLQNFFNRRGLVLETQLLRLMGYRTLREFCSQPGFESLATRATDAAAAQDASASDQPPETTGLARWLRRLVQRLRRWLRRSRFPAYIPSDVFADLAVSWYQRSHRSREWCDDHEFGRVMLRLVSECDADQARLRAKVAEWFDKAMQRATGRFKARSNLWFSLIAVVLVIAANADTLRLATEMYRNPAIQEALVAQAGAWSEGKTSEVDTTKLKRAIQAFPLLGWPEREVAEQDRAAVQPTARWDRFVALSKVALGYLITVLALMMGADFWFNALQKLIRIRTSLKPEEAKADAAKAAEGAAGAAGSALELTPTGGRAAQPVAALPRTEPLLPVTLSANAATFARISAFAYDRSADPVLPDDLQAAGYSAGARFDDKATGTQGLLLEHADHRVLAFRGTEPSEFVDIQTDLKRTLVAFPNSVLDAGAGRVHQGFAQGLAGVWAQVIDALRAGDAARPLIVTGHSLGGALAVLAAFALRQQSTPLHVQGVYTYGQPRAGDAAFAEAYDSLFRLRHWRMVNHRDAVPRLPPRKMGFRHTGRVLYFGPDGTPSVDPSRWFRLLDLIPIDADMDWSSQVSEFATDHAIAAYIGLLSALEKEAG